MGVKIIFRGRVMNQQKECHQACSHLATRIRSAAFEAELVFWREVARQFPEVTSGDLDPLSSYQFELAIEKVISTWLEWNLPPGSPIPQGGE